LFIDKRLSFFRQKFVQAACRPAVVWMKKTMDEPDADCGVPQRDAVHTIHVAFSLAGSRAVAKLGRNVGDKELVGKAERARKDRVG